MRRPWRELPRDFRDSVGAVANGLGCSRWVAACIVARFRGMAVADLDPRVVAQCPGRAPTWVSAQDSGRRPTAYPPREVSS